MKPVRTPDCDVTLTLPGGTDENDLPAQRIMVYDSDLGETENDAKLAFESLWLPDEAEARKLEAGAPVVLRVTGQQHPPVSLSVGNAVVPERELVARSTIDTAIGKLFADLVEGRWLFGEDEGSGQSFGIIDAPTFSDMWIAAMRAAQGASPIDEISEQNGTPAEVESEQAAISECATCGMPVRTVFKDGEIVRVLAPCGHPTKPDGQADA